MEGSALELLQRLGIGDSRLSIHVGEKMQELREGELERKGNVIGEYFQ